MDDRGSAGGGPGVIFLAEAFTRPKLMKRLAKVGYNQSYSYFTWRNLKWELREYLTELTKEECAEYMRPNFFVNTPDINPLFSIRAAGRAFASAPRWRATLAGNYGVYSGFELCEYEPLVTGKEEYKDSEKYEVRAFDWKREGHIRDDFALLNRCVAPSRRCAISATWNSTSSGTTTSSISASGRPISPRSSSSW